MTITKTGITALGASLHIAPVSRGKIPVLTQTPVFPSKERNLRNQCLKEQPLKQMQYNDKEAKRQNRLLLMSKLPLKSFFDISVVVAVA